MAEELILLKLLKTMVERRASDLHITEGAPPKLRLDGVLLPLKMPALTAAETKQLAYSILTEAQRATFERTLELDCSFALKDHGRFRMNVYSQRGAVCAAFRAIPTRIPELRSLGLPAVVSTLTQQPYGLVLVTGPTGSGKSTTLASMIDAVNRERSEIIITIEDPIEYVHVHQQSIVNQREVRSDTHGFAEALRHVLRQDPDIILIGEMRDLETVEAALRLSETGHLTLATLHTNDAVQAIHRIVDVFPADQQHQVQVQLSYVLKGIVCQQLVPRADQRGRALACEVLIPNDAIRHLIREGKLHQIGSQMQLGQREHGMQSMNQALAALCTRRVVEQDIALQASAKPDELAKMLSGDAR